MNYTSLVVRTEVARGFLLVGDDEDGFVNVDMIAMPGDTIVLKNLLSNNGLPPMRGQKVSHTRVLILRLWTRM